MVVAMYEHRPLEPLDILDVARQPIFVQNKLANTTIDVGSEIATATKVFVNTMDEALNVNMDSSSSYVGSWQGAQFWGPGNVWKDERNYFGSDKLV